MFTGSKPQIRKIKYVEAINEAFHQIMESDDSVFVLGVGVNSPWYVGRSMSGLYERFGQDRVIDPPVAENGITGIAIGAALAGMRPVVVHPRMDFMYLAMDQIVNHAASWHYMFGGRVNVPVTIRGIVNRGGEQAAQHSQNLAAFFMHVPGLKVVAPSMAYDAKGLLIASILDDNPVIYIDDRWLYENQGAQRFGSDNRLFIVLHDTKNADESWRIKRDIDFVKNNINMFFDTETVTKKDEIVFTFQKHTYTAISKILLLAK